MALSEAAQDYGRAMCVPSDRQSLPLAQLTPQEQACVTGVGGRWEERVDEAFGIPYPGASVGYAVQNDAGGQIGTLRMDDQGNVLLCAQGKSCAVVGQGAAAAAAVEQALSLLGLTVGEQPT